MVKLLFTDSYLPKFTQVKCPYVGGGIDYDMCIDVYYPENGSRDIMVLREKTNAEYILKGQLQKENDVPVTVFLDDAKPPETLVNCVGNVYILLLNEN